MKTELSSTTPTVVRPKELPLNSTVEWNGHDLWFPHFFTADGLTTLNTAAFATPEVWEAGLTMLAGLFLIAVHRLNRPLCRRYPRYINMYRCHS